MHWAADGGQKKKQIGSQPEMQAMFEGKTKLAEQRFKYSGASKQKKKKKNLSAVYAYLVIVRDALCILL